MTDIGPVEFWIQMVKIIAIFGGVAIGIIVTYLLYRIDKKLEKRVLRFIGDNKKEEERWGEL